MTDEQREKNRARCKANYAAHRAERLEKQRRYAAVRRESERVRAAAWRAANQERHLAMVRSYRASHQDELNARQRTRQPERTEKYREQRSAHYRNHRDDKRAQAAVRRANADRSVASAKTAAWRAANPARARAACRAYARKNPGIVNALSMKHQIAKRNALPTWANLDAMNAIYQEAARLSRETGIQYDVDHIYPLQGKTVCGLHVEHNLQILPHIDNVRKGNKLPQIAAA